MTRFVTPLGAMALLLIAAIVPARAAEPTCINPDTGERVSVGTVVMTKRAQRCCRLGLESGVGNTALIDEIVLQKVRHPGRCWTIGLRKIDFPASIRRIPALNDR